MIETSTIRLIPVLLLALCLWLFAPSALADTRVVVRAFPGPGGAKIRSSVVRVLGKQDGIQVVPNDEVDRAAKRRGLLADTVVGRREVGEELNLAIWIEGSVRKQAGGFALTIVARGGEDNEELVRFSALRNQTRLLSSAIAADLWETLGPAIAAAKPPAPAPKTAQPELGPQPPVAQKPWPTGQNPWALAEGPGSPSFDVEAFGEPKPPPSAEPNEAKAARPKREQTGLQLALTMNALHRTLTYQRASSPELANYALGAAPLGDAAARLFPFVFSGHEWLSWLGLDMRGQVAFALTSEGQGKIRYTTRYDSFGGGLVGRVPLGRHELNAVVGYNVQRFRVGDADGKPAPVPSVDYRAFRYALGARIAVVERLQIGLEAAFLQVQTTGELGSVSWFPRSKAFAVEGMLYADIRLLGPVSLRARVAFEHVSLDLNAKAADRRVAAAAVDGYLTGGLGLALAF